MPSKSVGAEDLEKVKRVVFSFGRVQHRLSRRNLAPLATSTSATSSSSPTAALLVSIKPPSIVAQQVRKSEKRTRSEGASKEVKHSPSSDAPSASMSMSPAVDRRNARERNRVKLVNSGYDALRHRIPLAREDKKMSKVDILRSAVDYIRHLQWVIGSPSATNDGLPHSHKFSDERIFSLDLNTCSSAGLVSDDDDNSMMESSTDCWPLSTSTLERYNGCGSDKENVDVQGSPRHRHEMMDEGKKFPSPPPAAEDSSAPCSTTGDGYHDQKDLAINQTMRPCFTALPPIHSVFSSFASVKDDELLVDKTHDEGNNGYTEFQAFFDHHQLLNFSTSSSNEEDSVSSTCNDVPGLIRTADHQPSSDEFRVHKDERQVPQNGSTHDAFVGVQQVAFSCF